VIIKLQDIKSDFAGFSRLADLAAEGKECFLDTIEVDFSSTFWFDANMSAPLGVIFSSFADDLNTVQPVAFPRLVEGVLSKNQFLLGYGYAARTDNYGTTIPFRRFKPEDDRYFAAYLNKHLEGKGIPKMSEGLGRRFRDSILEIFINAAMHSETRLGIFACGQFFPIQHRLDFCVADAGIGFAAKIERELKLALDPGQAISWALKAGNTTRKGDVPGGLGLKLLREFVKLNDGRLQIVSSKGYWEYAGGQETVKILDNPFPGTVLNIEINTADARSYCLESEIALKNVF